MTVKKSHSGRKVYLVAGKRTPFGKFGGDFAALAPVDLAFEAGVKAIEQVGIAPAAYDHVIFANVLPVTTDTLYGARHLAIRLGMPEQTPAYNVNRLCGSGIQAILDAARLIRLEEAELVLAAGAETMSLAPHMMYGTRFGTRFGSLQSSDMLFETLTDKMTGMPMAMTAERLAEKFSISRERCDEFALHSHLKANDAYARGLMQEELVPIKVNSNIIDKDQHLREHIVLDDMRKLKPSFAANGTVTPATASGIVDGGSCLILASEMAVEKYGLSPLVEVVDGAVIGVDPKIMGIGPVAATEKLLAKQNMHIEDIDLFEINEAFSAQVIACIDELKIGQDKVNIWGGAISLGHPLGATGLRISLTLARQMKETSLDLGVASACIGGGQGISILLRRL